MTWKFILLFIILNKFFETNALNLEEDYVLSIPFLPKSSERVTELIELLRQTGVDFRFQWLKGDLFTLYNRGNLKDNLQQDVYKIQALNLCGLV